MKKTLIIIAIVLFVGGAFAIGWMDAHNDAIRGEVSEDRDSGLAPLVVIFLALGALYVARRKKNGQDQDG